MERENLKSMIEAVLFLSAEPLVPEDLKDVLQMNEKDIVELLEELHTDYAERNGGILIGRVAGGYQMITNPAQADLIRRLRGTVRTQKLTTASLETLAVVAYKQPITKAEVEEIRGANSDGVMKSLLDKRLIKIVGKKEAPGKPMLYSTTREFLQYFGLSDLTELPTLKDLEREDAA